MNLLARPPTPAQMRTEAMRLVEAGLSVLPIGIDGQKRPAWQLLPQVPRGDGTLKSTWKPYQSRIASPDEILRWFPDTFGFVCGLAVIGGQVSGGLEVLDFDDYPSFGPWLDAVVPSIPDIADRYVFIETPGPGVHAYYRCATVEANQSLARLVELNDAGPPQTKVAIETRGEGGYAIIPPSPGYCHPSGRPYTYLTGRHLAEVPTITPEERRVLLDAARRLDAVPQPSTQPHRAKPQVIRRTLDRSKPGDDYEARTTWAELLYEHGWTYLSESDGVQSWRRPGKAEGQSATVNHDGTDRLYVFSTNATPLEAERYYSRFQFTIALEFGGDFDLALETLRRRGFGRSRSSPSRRGHTKFRRRRK